MKRKSQEMNLKIIAKGNGNLKTTPHVCFVLCKNRNMHAHKISLGKKHERVIGWV